MRLRRGWYLACAVCLGCHTALPLTPTEPAPDARALWEQGQEAMKRGRPDEAIRHYESSLTADPSLVRNHLSLAAAHLEKGNDASACDHLAAYVEANPDQTMTRARFAELLWRLRRVREARAEFDRYITDAQQKGGDDAQHLIRSHSRLMEIAEVTGDRYGEHLHRGIGLFLLARERDQLPDPEGELPVQGLLCKAAAELTLARELRPQEARAAWYLYRVWHDLGQRQPALCSLRTADSALPFAYLTPAEQRDLQIAAQRCLTEGRRTW